MKHFFMPFFSYLSLLFDLFFILIFPADNNPSLCPQLQLCVAYAVHEVIEPQLASVVSQAHNTASLAAKASHQSRPIEHMNSLVANGASVVLKHISLLSVRTVLLPLSPVVFSPDLCSSANCTFPTSTLPQDFVLKECSEEYHFFSTMHFFIL